MVVKGIEITHLRLQCGGFGMGGVIRLEAENLPHTDFLNFCVSKVDNQSDRNRQLTVGCPASKWGANAPVHAGLRVKGGVVVVIVRSVAVFAGCLEAPGLLQSAKFTGKSGCIGMQERQNMGDQRR